MIKGIVLKGIGGFYYVDSEGEDYECRARGKLRLDGKAPLAGDSVLIEKYPDKTGYLIQILPRKNAMLRPPVANVDNLFIVASAADPATDLFWIDKICVAAYMQQIRIIILLNKCDLDRADFLYGAYTQAGYEVIRMSAATGEGTDAVRNLLPGRLSAFIGNSGVGKSSILNLLSPGAKLETGDLSRKIGRGCHTTSSAELIKLDDNTFIADTPGFSAFDFLKIEEIKASELVKAFIEFSPYTDKCRYQGCAHVKEAGCAVLHALAEGQIPKSRFESYVRMINDLKNVKEWKV